MARPDFSRLIGDPIRQGVRGVAAIAGIGAALTFAMGRGWFAGTFFRGALTLGAMCIVGGSLLRLTRRGVLRDTMAARIQDFGGGGYGVAGFATWLYLEVVDFIGDLSSAQSAGDYVDRHVLEWVMGFSGEMIRNLINAAIWPAYWLSNGGFLVAGAVALAGWGVAEGLARLLPPVAEEPAPALTE